jgi:hypothetical protein
MRCPEMVGLNVVSGRMVPCPWKLDRLRSPRLLPTQLAALRHICALSRPAVPPFGVGPLNEGPISRQASLARRSDVSAPLKAGQHTQKVAREAADTARAAVSGEGMSSASVTRLVRRLAKVLESVASRGSTIVGAQRSVAWTRSNTCRQRLEPQAETYRTLIEIAEEVVANAKTALDTAKDLQGETIIGAMKIDAIMATGSCAPEFAITRS